MASPATWRSQNIKRSVQEFLTGLSLSWTDQEEGSATLGQTFPVVWTLDAILEQLPARGAWVDVVWRKRSPQGGNPQILVPWVFECQCWSRMKQDPLSSSLDSLVDDLLIALKQDPSHGKPQPILIPLYDYANPSAPVDTGFKVRLDVQADDYLPSTNLVFGRSVMVTASYIERY